MGITTSLLLVAIGAILIWAVDVSVSGIELVTIGWILLVVGAIGAVLSLIFWSSWGGYNRDDARRSRRSVTTSVTPRKGRGFVRALSRSPARDQAQTASVLGAVEAAAAAPAVSALRGMRGGEVRRTRSSACRSPVRIVFAQDCASVVVGGRW